MIGKKDIKQIDWSKVDMDDDAFHLTSYPVNNLPNTPTGRLAHVQDLAASELISKKEARFMMGHLDIYGEEALDNSDMNLIDSQLEMIADGETVVPKDWQDPELVVSRANKYLAQAEIDNADDEVIERINQYINTALSYVQEEEEAAAAEQAAMDPSMGGMPMDPSMMGPPMSPMGPGPEAMPPEMAPEMPMPM